MMAGLGPMHDHYRYSRHALGPQNPPQNRTRSLRRADRPNFARTVRPPEEIAHHDRQLAILLLPHIKKLAFHRNCGLAVSA